MKKTLLKVLSVMMMLAMVVTAVVIPNTEAKAADKTKTIYVQVDSAYTNPHLYAWVNNGSNISDWPGTKLESSMLENGWYKISVPANIDRLIVNNGGDDKKTSDMDISKMNDNNLWVSVNANAKTVISPEGAFDYPSTITVHVKGGNWSMYKIHHWGGSNGTSWPGALMADSDNDGWYDYNLPIDASGFLFTDMESDSSTEVKSWNYENWGFAAEIWFTLSDEKGGDGMYSYQYAYIDPNAITAEQVIAKIDAIGTVELTEACKKAIEDADAMYNSFTGNKANVTNYDKLTAAKTEFDNLMKAGAGKLTIHIKNAGWDKVNMYTYDVTNTSKENLGGWPGTTLTEDTEHAGWYTGTVDVQGCVNVSINANGSTKQLSDIKYLGAGEYWVVIEAKDGQQYDGYTISDEEPTGWTTTTPGGNTQTPENPNMGDLDMLPVYVMLFAGLALVSVAVVAKKKVA